MISISSPSSSLSRSTTTVSPPEVKALESELEKQVSDLLKDKVASSADPGQADWTWAVKEDGTFAVDAATGQTYVPNVQTVDFGSLMTADSFNATDYQVICDGDDNLYVVWSDTVQEDMVDEQTGNHYQKTAQEIFASALIREEMEGSETATDIETGQEADSTGSIVSANWSKPYRLTRDNSFNDGIAVQRLPVRLMRLRLRKRSCPICPSRSP